MTTEVMTTHQKIQEAHRENTAQIVGEKVRSRQTQHVVTSDIEQIKVALQALIDKVSSLDLYVRSRNAHVGSVYSEPKASKTEIINQSLERIDKGRLIDAEPVSR
jgi:hypothetical protein